MKILCLFSTDLMPWLIARHWLKGLVDAGAEVCVGCPAGPYVPVLEDFGLPVRQVYVSRSLNPAEIVRAIASVSKLIRSERWDILNCHGASAGLIGRAAARLAPKMQVVATNHGYYFDEHMAVTRRALAIAVERVLAMLTDLTMFVSSEDYDTALRKRIIRDPSKAALLLNGIDLTQFPGRPSPSEVAEARSRLGIPFDAEVIGTVGRLIIEKGLVEFFEAARRLCAARPNLYAVVVGDALLTDRGACKKQLLEKVKATGLTSRFRFPGFASDMYACLSAFDLLVHPSYKESFGLVIAEAMGTALPVVATDVRGCREVVVHGQTGLLVPYRGVDEIVKAVSSLLDDRPARVRMGDAGRSRVVERYDQREVVRRFVGHIMAAGNRPLPRQPAAVSTLNG